MGSSVFIGNGQEGRSQEALVLPNGKAGWFCLKGKNPDSRFRRSDHRDALGIQVTNDGDLAFSIADGVSMRAPDSAEIAALIVKEVLAEANRHLTEGHELHPREWHSAARDEVRKLHKTKNGAATAISGVIRANLQNTLHIVGDPHSGHKTPTADLFAFPRPKLMPQGITTQPFWEHLRLNRYTEDDACINTPWQSARNLMASMSNPPLHFIWTQEDGKIKPCETSIPLQAGDWLIVGSDGLLFSTNPFNNHMQRFNQILRGTNDPQKAAMAMADHLEREGTDNATALVFRANG